MNNIIRAQFYKALHNKVIYFTLIVTCIVGGMTILDIEEAKITGSMMAIYNAAISFAIAVFVVIATAQIVGSDFFDKTINYEILSGHKRIEVYIARWVVSAVIGVIGSIILISFYPSLFTIINGWGDLVELSDYFNRIGCVLLIVIKITCTITMISFIVKNHYIAIGIAFACYYSEFITYMLVVIPKNLKNVLLIPQINQLLIFSTEKISGNEVAKILIISTVESVILIVCGYQYFKKMDME